MLVLATRDFSFSYNFHLGSDMASYAMEALSFDNPKDWFVRMEAAHQLLTASSGKDIPQKTFAIATMGQQASTLLADLLAPQSIDCAEVTYAVLKETLVLHLQSQHLEMAERAAFYSITQRDGENAASFFSRLKKAAEFCNFDGSFDTGAAVTLISEPMWRDLGSPTLQASGKVFTAYDGHRKCSVKACRI